MSGGGKADRHPLVDLARRTIESYVRNGSKPSPPADPSMSGKAGVFVSIKRSGQLRGCIGTIMPVRASIGEEVVENAVSAATRDPRFPPVEADELDDLAVSVDVLTEPEPVMNISDLDPSRYGVIVRSGERSGVLLPDLAGIDTPEEQVAIAMRKAGIKPGDEVNLYRFEVQRYL